MSLELIDRILASWEDPDYGGIIEQLSFHKYKESSLDIEINKKLIKDIEQIRFLKPSIIKMSEYSKDKEGLIAFYKDHNFIQAHPRELVNAYRMMPFPEQDELDKINKYLHNAKFIMQVGFGEGLRSLNFLENSNAKLVIFSDFKHDYSFYGRHFLDELYRDRHCIVFGITKNSIPNFSLDKESHIKFDIIHYNNNRKYYEIYEEVLNCLKYTDENTILMLDGVCPHIPSGTGPYVAMNKLIRDGILTFVEHIKINNAEDTYINGIAILKFNKNNQDYQTKIPLSEYKNIELKMPLYEFTNFIIDNFRNDEPVEKELVELYLHRLINAGVEIDKTLKNYLSDHYSIYID